ncbi:MAG: nucleotide disphospho-sugar-binding domain-containing protein, partial [Gordonia sp. (in: high G+C Gram-positive bacteria)]|uniref:glycosyltransferase n=1 Tax=Gordonia sp. (in: high G+C Gram-positive bacteria) TaxID=84139 RepID=UPI003BB5E8CB
APVRVVYSSLEPPTGVTDCPPGMVTGLGRQDLVLAHADLVICGGGHGLLAKALSAQVPVVVVPGGGDQWELASRVRRAGAGAVVRPVTRDGVAEAVATVLSDRSYAAAAAGLAGTLRQTVDPVRLVHRVVEEAACE